MKKNLRMLCLGLAAATFTASFAQAEDVTSKLMNADMEKGVIGWNLKFDSHIWKKNKKDQAYQPGFHGITGNELEIWKSDATSGLSDNTISQTVNNLPNGTYVFGAYIAATVQTQEENRESVTGVSLFANEASVPVATNNPEVATQKWGHSAKFNVAVNVIDGTLTVGLKSEATNVNYIVWDNATLYYFGDMDAAAALDEMAKIDMAATVAIADTCVAYKMHEDTATYLNEQIAAGKALISAAEAYDTDENVYWAIRLANKSIADYRGLSNSIAAAKEVAAMEWTESVATAVEKLNTLITEAEGIYEAAAANRDEIVAKKDGLAEATAYVELDSSYIKIDLIGEWLDETEPGDELGQYTEEMLNKVSDLLEEVGQVLEESDNGLSAVTAKHKCDSLYAAIQDIQDNPLSFDEFPIMIERGEQAFSGYKLMEGTTTDEAGVVTYTSKLYRFQYPLTKIRFIVHETGSNALNGSYPFFTMQRFEMFDEDGNEIELSEGDIYSNADHNRLNPGSPDGAGILGLIDDDPNTFFHSTWGVSVNEPHYLEVTLPEGEYSAFSFSMTGRGTNHPHQFPAVFEVNHLSEAASNLQSVVGAAQALNAYRGTAPGFYNTDLTAFNEALAAAEALLGTDASDAEIMAAIDKLEAEITKIDELGIVLPEPGKKYRFISAGPFFAQQGIHKAITTHSDSAKVNWIWWETASADSLQQEFSFEPIPNEDGKYYYYVKHEATGLYINSLLDPEGEEVSNSAGLSAEKDTVELQPFGAGQFGIIHNGMFHTGDHNAGVVGTGSTVYGCAEHAVKGDKSGICKWTATANSGSAWFIREVRELPYAAKSLSDLNFQTETITLYSGINTLTLTADKDCAFADLKVYDLMGAEIPASVAQAGATATVVLDTTVVEAFSFAFTNAEGVATVTVDGVISKLSILQDSYDAAIAAAPVVGDEIGQFTKESLSEYTAAIKAAEAILANGGDDDAIQQAANDLDSAVVHLRNLVNLPLADKTYFILSGLPAFYETHGVDMAIYAKADAPAWSYVGVSDPAYLWKFVEAEPMYGARVFYLQNVGTEMYMGSSDYLSTALTMVPETSATQPFRVDVFEGGELTICDGRYNNGNLHLNGHGGGANAFGNIVYWSSNVGTASSLKIVESEKYISDLMDSIEDVEFVDEYVAPAKKGIYDLFGRRIETPAATGIYIVDGKKRVIKK